MRRNLTKVMAVLMVLVMAFAFTGCGSKKDEPAVTTAAEPETTTAEPETTTESGKYASLAEWYDDNAAEFKEVEDTLNASTTDCVISLLVEGDTLIYRYVYKEAIDISDASVKEQITTTFDTYFADYESTFSSLADQLAQEAGLDEKNVKVMIEVLNPDETVIYVKEFSK